MKSLGLSTDVNFYVSEYKDKSGKKNKTYLMNRDAQLFGIKDAGRKGEILMNEFGLYDLVLDAPLPSAKAFRKWVTHEVLPQIRKTGGYIPVTKENKRAKTSNDTSIRRSIKRS